MTENPTPFPWTIYDDSDPLSIKIKGEYSDIGGAHVATVLGHGNARTIIALPELVAALEAVQSEIILTGNLADVVEAALAKTKGGSAPSAPRGQNTPKPGEPANRGAIAQTFLDETDHADTHDLADVMLKHWDVRWR